MLEKIRNASAENRARFKEIYSLTLHLCSTTKEWVTCSTGPLKCWKDILRVWNEYAEEMDCPDMLYAALYHIHWGRFQPTVKSDELKGLILLVENELLKDERAFEAWYGSLEFKRAFDKVLTSVRHKKQVGCGWNSETFRKYLDSRMYMKVVYKEQIPTSDWLLDVHELDTFYCAKELYNYRNDFETAIKRFLPEANNWDAEWCDETYILNRIKAVHGIDYTLDYDDFDQMYLAVRMFLRNKSYEGELVLVKNFPHSMAVCLWGDQTDKRIYALFANAYSKHRAAKAKNMYPSRSKYCRKNIEDSWVYKLLYGWYASKDSRLTGRTKEKFFNFSIGV